MALKTASVLQFGDVHFPSEKRQQADIDVKDESFPPALIAEIVSPRLGKVVRKIQEVIDAHRPPHGIFVGDLTTGADVKAYGEALDYFYQALAVGRKELDPTSFLQIIPGNHDLERNKTFDLSLDQKFAPFKEMIAARNLPPLPIDGPRVVEIPVDLGGAQKPRIHLILINSCYGCGEQRHLPEQIRSAIVESYRKIAEQAESEARSTEERAKKLAEVLFQTAQSMDTPIIAEDDLGFIDAYVRKLPKIDVPIVCAHHNFLPQFRPRIDTYTELLNAGNLRRVLLELERPVLFLHGHIHDDPIDVITDPKRQNSLVISISAPLFRQGFNAISIAYNTMQIPIGCRIEEFRISDSGRTSTGTILVPFWTNSNITAVLSDDAHALFSAMARNKTYRLLELPSISREIKSRFPSIKDLKDVVEELKWLELVDVTVVSTESDHWTIRRLV